MGFVSTTYSIIDGDGFVWDFYRNGEVVDGTDDAFDYAFDFSNFTSSASIAELSDDGRRLDFVPEFEYYSDVILERSVFVSPTSNYARMLDSITNTGGSAITYTYSMRSAYGQDGSYVFRTSSGDAVFQNRDTWYQSYSSDSTDTNTKSGHLYTDGTLKPTVDVSYDTVTITYEVTIDPGETVSFLNYGVQGNTRNQVVTTLKGLASGTIDGLDGMTAEEIESVVNFDLGSLSLRLEGTGAGDFINGGGSGDRINGLGGEDELFGHGGDDTIEGGNGADLISGGAGNDSLYGNSAIDYVTTTKTKKLSDGSDLAISLTLPDAAGGTSVDISGFLSREPIQSENLDLVFVVDVSGSTSGSFLGTVNVGDKNGDGYSDTILDAEIAAFEALHRSIVTDAGLPDANITLISFDTGVYRSQTLRANADANGDGVADIVEVARSFQDSGGTDYEVALQEAVSYFKSSPEGQRALYFLSDGEHNSGNVFSDEVQKLLNLGVSIQSFGIGSDASEADLDIVDDKRNNNSTTIVLDPDLLQDELLDPGIEVAEIDKVQVLLNGSVVKTIPKSSLVVTPFGLRYFETTVNGLKADAKDVISLRVIAKDAAGTRIVTTQTLENDKSNDKGDKLMGNEGSDLLDGGAGADILLGGAGADLLIGGAGRDRASYADSEIGLTVDLGNSSNNTGYARGDEFRSIEIVRGSHYRDSLYGASGQDELEGGRGADRLFGRANNDKLSGNEGSDRLFGGAGNDDIWGSAGKDRLFGGDGKDRLFGGADADTLEGGAGADRLFGRSGADRLIGGTGADVLQGGAGNDRISGNKGADTFVFAGNDGRNVITDYEDGVDTIRITDGADRFRDLDISRVSGHIEIAFDQTVVVVDDVSLNNLTGSDFDFT